MGQQHLKNIKPTQQATILPLTKAFCFKLDKYLGMLSRIGLRPTVNPSVYDLRCFESNRPHFSIETSLKLSP